MAGMLALTHAIDPGRCRRWSGREPSPNAQRAGHAWRPHSAARGAPTSASTTAPVRNSNIIKGNEICGRESCVSASGGFGMEAPCWSQFEEILEADLSITRFTSPEPGHPYRPYNGLDGRREDGKIPGRSGLGGRESPGQTVQTELHHLRRHQRDPTPCDRPGHLGDPHSVALTCTFGCPASELPGGEGSKTTAP